jgi:hypothetical protein
MAAKPLPLIVEKGGAEAPPVCRFRVFSLWMAAFTLLNISNLTRRSTP